MCLQLASSVEEEDSDGDPSSPVHDLSAWRVTVPMIGARPDPENIKRQFFVFIIEVGRADMLEGNLMSSFLRSGTTVAWCFKCMSDMQSVGGQF